MLPHDFVKMVVVVMKAAVVMNVDESRHTSVIQAGMTKSSDSWGSHRAVAAGLPTDLIGRCAHVSGQWPPISSGSIKKEPFCTTGHLKLRVFVFALLLRVALLL